MKKEDLSNYFKTISRLETIEVNGGGKIGPPSATYMTPEQIKATGDAVKDVVDFMVGFVKGLFNY